MSARHLFRFGIINEQMTARQSWLNQARRAEELGYATFLIRDHFVPDFFGDQFAPFSALMAAAAVTSRLRVGTLVLDNDYRHPVVLAKEIATLDLLSEGRVEVGVGAGWMRSDYTESGIAYDRPGVRVDRLSEGLAIMKALWAEGSATFAGEHYTVTAAQGMPRPHSRPHPPLIIGGGSPRVLGIAAREADIVGVNPNLAAGEVSAVTIAEAVPAKFDERLAWVRDAAGDRLADIELQCLTFIVQVGTDARTVAGNLAPMFGLEPEEALDVPIALVGTVDEICDTLERRRQRWGFNYWVVHEAELDAFAPVVARMAGR